jgi:site-specific recombinase XerD
MLDERVKDKSYQRTPIGQQVKHWLETLRFLNYADNTLNSYETTGARLALEFADLDGLHELAVRGSGGVGRLQHFLIKHWGDRNPKTRDQRTAALRSLFEWAWDQGSIDWNPGPALKKTRGQKQESPRRAHKAALLVQLLYRQKGYDKALRDRVCLMLLCRLGLRKEAVRLMQARDIHVTTGTLGFRLKGGGWGELPYEEFATLKLDLEFLLQAEEYKPRDYLLYPKNDRTRPMDRSAVHRWFKRCLERAELPDFPMHELRHSVAMFQKQSSDSDGAKELLKHKSLSTTELYLHPDDDELRGKMSANERAWQQELVIAGVRSGTDWDEE